MSWRIEPLPRSVALDLRLADYRAGGIARYARELLDALRRCDDARLRLIELRAARAPARPGVARLRTPPHHRWELVALPLELRLRRVRPDVFHAVDFIAPKVPGARVVATVHDLDFLDRPDALTPDALAWYRRLDVTRRWTDAWITPSRWTAQRLAAAYDIAPARIAVIPHGVPAFLAGVVPLGRDQRDDYILAVGTVEPRKRLELLLDALPRLPEPLRLVIAGSPGWNSAALEARLRSTPRVEWHRSPSDATLRELYRRALAVAVPSWAEGFGFSALEAMACGTPVLSSGGGALPEVTGDAALTPDPDPAAWAAAISRLASQAHLWEALATAGYRRARERTWEQAALDTAQVYLADPVARSRG